MFYLKFQKIMSLILFIAVLFSLFFPFKEYNGNWTEMIVIFPVLVGLLAYFLLLTRYYIQKVTKIIYCRCDYELFCKKAKMIAESKNAYRTVREGFRLARVTSLYAGGRFEEAIDEFKKIDLSYMVIVRNTSYFIDYNNLLITYYLWLGQLDEAQKALEIIRNNAANIKNSSTVLESQLKIAEAKIDFYLKEYYKCIDLYDSLYNDPKTVTINKVNSAYCLGVIYSIKDPERAKVFLNYVLDHGNKLYVVKEAQEQLKAIAPA